nr:uncharacterized protein LOC109416380 [Aedes albopictus]
MESIIKLLQFCGFWSQPYQRHRLRKPLCHIGVIVGCLLGPGIIFIVRNSFDFESAISAAIESMGFVNTVLLGTNLLYHRSALESAYGDIKLALQTAKYAANADVLGNIEFLEKSTSFLFKGYTAFQSVVGTGYALTIPSLTLIHYTKTGQLPPLHGIFEADFFVFDFTTKFWLWVVVIVIGSFGMLCLISVLVIVSSFNWSLVHYLIGLFKIVHSRISCLDDLPDQQSRQKELTEIVQLQELVYRCARTAESALNIFLLTQFGTCVVAIGLTMMTLTLASNDRDLLIKMVLMLAYILFNIFVYSMLGQELMSTSTSVADAAYGTRWYDWSLSEQRNVLFVVSRSQRMAALTTGKFFVVNRATFAATLQAAYSNFTILRQMLESR